MCRDRSRPGRSSRRSRQERAPAGRCSVGRRRRPGCRPGGRRSALLRCRAHHARILLAGRSPRRRSAELDFVDWRPRPVDRRDTVRRAHGTGRCLDVDEMPRIRKNSKLGLVDLVCDQSQIAWATRRSSALPMTRVGAVIRAMSARASKAR